MRWISSHIFRFMGWKTQGYFSELPKYVIIVGPHTSWTDFVIGLLTRSIHKLDAYYLGKAELFVFPLGWVFRLLGGYPVERSKSQNLVDSVIQIFESKSKFRIALAPEGTRKKVESLKSGFYFIAVGAKIPIVMVAFDYGKKEVRIEEPFMPTGNLELDMAIIKKYYSGVQGRHPDKGID